jgi:diaminohydroxyphosphoribosylaminopyrimidine deaminase/5-amino-6-(5-phosphoribosylamino)uracil reductase
MHEEFLSRCLKLAQQGETLAHPNPIVGCVITHNGKILAEGFHRYFGKEHAEVNAINSFLNSVSNHTQIEIKDCAIYVSLEPCSHHGKTPPCADLIIKHKFKTLTYSCRDPHPNVSGKGIASIANNGIEVIGPNEIEKEITDKSFYLNRVFFHCLTNPYWLTCKIARDENLSMLKTNLAQADARDPSSPQSGWITNPESRKRSHRLRSCHQALITSLNTVIADNPFYNIRHSPSELGLADIKNPDVVILKNQKDFSDTERSSLNLFNHNISRQILELKNKIDYTDLKTLMESLAVRGYSKIMLEAGPRLSLEFLKADLVNELVIYQKISKEDYQKIKRLKAFLSLDFSQSAPEFTYLKKFLSDDFTSNLLKSTQPIYIKLDFCYSENSEEESNVDEEVGIPDMEIRIGKYPRIL